MSRHLVPLLGAAMLAAGCDEPPTPKPDRATPAKTSAGAVAPVPAPKSVPMSELRPRPKQLRFGMATMGKGPVDEYEIELDLQKWTLAGAGRWDEEEYELPEPTPLSSAQRKTLEPTLDAMRLVTDGPAECQRKKDDPTISCGSDSSITIDGEIYSGDSKSCEWVDYPPDADPHEAVGRAFRKLAKSRSTTATPPTGTNDANTR